MRNIYGTLFAALISGLFIMGPISSYADWNGHNGDGHSHGGGGHWNGGGHGHSYVGVNFSVFPDSYYYGAPYYYYSPEDEVIVSPPVTVVEQQSVTVIQPPAVIDNQATSDSFTINIPNNKGGYTAVTLKKLNNGFTGPQGEFYTEFPRVSQLEVMYGK